MLFIAKVLEWQSVKRREEVEEEGKRKIDLQVMVKHCTSGSAGGESGLMKRREM